MLETDASRGANWYAVVLAGGQGARFWPLSRRDNPKQFLSISDSGESLIQATCRRVDSLVGKERTVIVTNILHEKRIRAEVPSARVLSEPIGRNTTAAIAFAAFVIEAADPGAVMFVLPADHAVSSEENLRKTLSRAGEVAEKEDLLVTVGIPLSTGHRLRIYSAGKLSRRRIFFSCRSIL